MVRALLLVCALASCLPAQSWDAVRALKTGDAVKVQDQNRVEHKGSVAAVGEDAISLRVRNAEISVNRAGVRRVQVKSGGRRLRNLAIGAGVGLAAGIAIDRTLGEYLRNESNDNNRPLFYVVPIGLFGGIGAALAPYKTIYRAP